MIRLTRSQNNLFIWEMKWYRIVSHFACFWRCEALLQPWDESMGILLNRNDRKCWYFRFFSLLLPLFSFWRFIQSPGGLVGLEFSQDARWRDTFDSHTFYYGFDHSLVRRFEGFRAFLLWPRAKLSKFLFTKLQIYSFGVQLAAWHVQGFSSPNRWNGNSEPHSQSC